MLIETLYSGSLLNVWKCGDSVHISFHQGGMVKFSNDELLSFFNDVRYLKEHLDSKGETGKMSEKIDVQTIADIVLIRPIKSDIETKSGLSLPETQMPHLLEGEVLSAGPGLYSSSGARMTPDCKVGDIVYYTGQIPWFTYFDKEGNEHRLIKQQAIVAYRPSVRIAADKASIKIMDGGSLSVVLGS